MNLTEKLTVLQESCILLSEGGEVNGVTWTDSTSYSQRGVRIPTSFTAKVGNCRVTITCGHISYKPQWIFHCHALGFTETRLTVAITAQEAAAEAIAICKQYVAQLYDRFNTL